MGTADDPRRAQFSLTTPHCCRSMLFRSPCAPTGATTRLSLSAAWHSRPHLSRPVALGAHCLPSPFFSYPPCAAARTPQARRR